MPIIKQYPQYICPKCRIKMDRIKMQNMAGIILLKCPKCQEKYLKNFY